MNHFVGGVVSSENDTPVQDRFIRLPAEIQDTERNHFVLHFPGRNVDGDTRKK